MSATRVAVACWKCGEQELEAETITVHPCTFHGASYYSFECPTCSSLVCKPASELVVRQLISYGSPAHAWAPPAELLEKHDGPPLTLDDLLDFHFELEAMPNATST